MRPNSWLRAGLAAALLPPLAILATATPGVAGPTFTVGDALTPSGRVVASKSASGRLAQTDPSLLGRTDAVSVPVLIKLDYDSVATYAGGVRGFAATSPTVTGRKLDGGAAERSYTGYVADQEKQFVGALAKRVPAASVRQRLRTVYGGVAATVPANKIGDLLKLDGVVAVQKDELRQPLTDASSKFIGATSMYPGLGGTKNAGKGVIVGIIDTGAWPEHPAFADQGNLGTPPAKTDGTARACDFGDNPLTPASDVFACNNKLIGGAAFLDTYKSVPSNPAEMYNSARDSGGHGTHTASTAAGNVVASAKVFGVERGPVNGVAPGAWVSVYKALGANGGYSSDLAAAVQQAVKDGVSVINYSISGGTNPFTDPVELAFKDAYAAGVFVAASAGNAGPGAATVNHVAPWTTTVAASTQVREFVSSLTLTGGADTLTLTGASITAGVSTATPVVLAQDVAGYSGGARCQAPATAGLFAGKIVACERGGNGRAEKGFNVTQGGAAGMILYNPTLADIETDNHFLPTVHLADGTQFKAFMAGHTGVTATFTAGAKHNGQADVMAAFSSRGPGGMGIKPDITGPGVQILAGNTPTPDEVAAGPAGELYQAIAGTSMSSPHVAGAAGLLKAAHPDWTPGQIKSALMTTARTQVLKEDLTTPATPFDHGSGRMDLTKAPNAGLTFDETAERMGALGADGLTAIHMNLPSINAPTMPGRVQTVRVARNVSGKTQTYAVKASAPANSKITVKPNKFTVKPGQSVALTITIESTAPAGQHFGQINLDPKAAKMPTLHLPVAFVPQQGQVSLTSECAQPSVARGQTVACTVTATNDSFGPSVVDLSTTVNSRLKVAGANGAKVTGPRSVSKKAVTLNGQAPGVPALGAGTVAGDWLPLSMFGVAPQAIGDEQFLHFDTPSFGYGGRTYNKISVDSNGYIVVGGGTSEDNQCCDLTQIPDPARPNNVLAPFWTDLDGTGADGIRATTLSDGTNSWLVVEWQVNIWGTTDTQQFQVWIGLNGEEDVVFAYNPADLPAAPAGQKFIVGAENLNGSGGAQLADGTAPTGDIRVTSSPATPGGKASYTVFVTGVAIGAGKVTTEMNADLVLGTTVVNTPIAVNPPGIGNLEQ